MSHLLVERPASWCFDVEQLMQFVGRSAGIAKIERKVRVCLILGHPVAYFEGRYRRHRIHIADELPFINTPRSYAVSIAVLGSRGRSIEESLLCELLEELKRQGLTGFICAS